MLTIDIGVACNKNQTHHWWGGLMQEILRSRDDTDYQIGKAILVGAALPDWSKCSIIDTLFGLDLTDSNRNNVVAQSLEGRSDGIWWLDDDTVPRPGTLRKLVAMWDRGDIIAGVYRKKKPPYEAVAYKRLPNNAYLPLDYFQPGEIIEADSVGMGCTLVKREVYERIRANYSVLMRKRNASMTVVCNDDLQAYDWPQDQADKTLIAPNGAVARIEVLEPVEVTELKLWPFYQMEHHRTEDHFFCEMAQRVGARIIVDTSVLADHWGEIAAGEEQYRDMVLQEARNARA